MTTLRHGALSPIRARTCPLGFRAGVSLQCAIAAPGTLGGGPQSVLGIDLEAPAQLRHGQQHLTEVSFAPGSSKLRQGSLDLGELALVPVVGEDPGCSGPLLHLHRPQQRGQRCRNAVHYRVPALLPELDGVPHAPHCIGIVDLYIPEDMGVASHQLGANLSGYVRHVERFSLRGQMGLEPDLVQQVAELLTQVPIQLFDATAVAVTTPAFVPGAGGGDVDVHQGAVILAAREWAEREAPGAPGAGPLRHLCSKHILVESRAEAEAVVALLDAGEEFGLLAVEFSLDPGSGSLGGDLGCVVEGSFVAPFETAAYAAEPGEVVVAESQFGFHVIQVTSSGPATPEHHPQIDAERLVRMARDAESAAAERAQLAVQDERRRLLVELQEAAVLEYASQVRIDKRYGFWDPVQFRVVLDPSDLESEGSGNGP